MKNILNTMKLIYEGLCRILKGYGYDSVRKYEKRLKRETASKRKGYLYDSFRT